MTFSASNGTRGARQPKAGAFMNWMNRQATRRIRRRGGKLFGTNLLVLNTIGSKTGAARSTPVGWFPGDDDSWLIVASANGGAKNPAWYYNIAANPDSVSIDIDRSNVRVTPTQLQGADRERAWLSITTASPRFNQYEARTDRDIPILRLARRG